MKKTIICMLVAASTASVFAQGTVNFSAFVPNYITFQTNSTTYSPLFGGGSTQRPGAALGATAASSNGFYYELLFTASGTSQPTSVSALASWTDSGLYAVNSSSQGRLTVGNGTQGSAVNGMALNTSYSVMLVGWSANLGTDWSTVLGELQNWSTAQNSVSGDAYLGMSTVGTIKPTSTTSPGAAIFGNTGTLINSPNSQLYLLPTVPEPGTIALAGLGVAGLLALRRKK